MKKWIAMLPLLLAVPAQADIISTVGLTQITAPSVTVQADFLANNGLPERVIWAEQQDYLLLSDLNTDTGIIAAGTRVSSYFVALNRLALANVVSDESVTFDRLVLGAVFEQDAAYNASPNYKGTDFLGAVNTKYNESVCGSYLPSGGACGFETFQSQIPPGVRHDTITLIGNTVLIGGEWSTPGDFARLIVAGNVPVPGPVVGAGLLPMLGAAGLFLLGYRRRKA